MVFVIVEYNCVKLTYIEISFSFLSISLFILFSTESLESKCPIWILISIVHVFDSVQCVTIAFRLGVPGASGTERGP